MKNLLKGFVRATEAHDLIEYALLAALVVLATTAAMSTVVGSLRTAFDKISLSITVVTHPIPGGLRQ